MGQLCKIFLAHLHEKATLASFVFYMLCMWDMALLTKILWPTVPQGTLFTALLHHLSLHFVAPWVLLKVILISWYCTHTSHVKDGGESQGKEKNQNGSDASLAFTTKFIGKVVITAIGTTWPCESVCVNCPGESWANHPPSSLRHWEEKNLLPILAVRVHSAPNLQSRVGQHRTFLAGTGTSSAIGPKAISSIVCVEVGLMKQDKEQYLSPIPLASVVLRDNISRYC